MGQAQPLGPDPVRLRFARRVGHGHRSQAAHRGSAEPVSGGAGEGEGPCSQTIGRRRGDHVLSLHRNENQMAAWKQVQSKAGGRLAYIAADRDKRTLGKKVGIF